MNFAGLIYIKIDHDKCLSLLPDTERIERPGLRLRGFHSADAVFERLLSKLTSFCPTNIALNTKKNKKIRDFLFTFHQKCGKI